MSLSLAVYISLAVFALALAARCSGWFIRVIGPENGASPFKGRFKAALAGTLGTVFSLKIFVVIGVFFRDALFQWPILRQSIYRFIMHMSIFAGFVFLLIFHALGKFVTAPLFDENFAYLNPFLFLRDAAGILVLLGLGMAVARRIARRKMRIKTNLGDVYAIFIVGLIILSGFALCSVKMTSHDVFLSMSLDYAGLDPEGTPDDLNALEAYWAANYGLVSPVFKAPFDQDLLTSGEAVNESCVSCHVKNGNAPASFALAKIMAPAAGLFNSASSVNILYWGHVLACLLGLAILPFTKMFHVFSTPLALVLKNTVTPLSRPENLMTRRLVALSACTHCGTCSLRCSAMMAHHVTGNPFILPSEKVGALKRLARGKKPTASELCAVSQGIMLCTNCDRCTVVCPSGLELRDIWVSARQGILLAGPPEPLVWTPFSFLRGLNREKLSPAEYEGPVETARKALEASFSTLADKNAELVVILNADTADIDPTFRGCFGCTNCTNVCPVVKSFDEPEKSLGLAPHQIMAAVGMGASVAAAGCHMVRECLTCYQCQEHCPQNVAVTDVIYRLKEQAARAFASKP